MHITELRIENFKRISALTIRPDGSLVKIEGANGQGKSSTLDAIWAGLRGKAVAPPTPVHKGAEKAVIRLKTEELVIIRTFKPDGESSLEVTRADGAKVPKPHAFLEALVGVLTFDPLAFAEAPAKDQFDMLRQLVPGFDFDANAAARKEAFDDRTVQNRLAKAAKAQRDGIILPDGRKPELVDVAALSDEITKAFEHNNSFNQRAARRNAAAQEADELRDKAERLRAEARDADAKAKAIEDRLIAAEPLPAPIDVMPLQLRLRDAEAINARARLFVEYDRHAAETKAYEDKATALTAAIEALDKAKADAVAKAKLPGENLSLGDGVVLLNGLPLADASDAERLRVSLAVAAALNPSLRIVRVKQGSLLDAKALEDVARFAEANDLQVWLERVADSPSENAFHIVDGALA